MARLPRINDDKGRWGIILNEWLKLIGGFAGDQGYGTNDELQAEIGGLNFNDTDPTSGEFANNQIPQGFTYINTTDNEIKRWDGSQWVVLLTAGYAYDIEPGQNVTIEVNGNNITQATTVENGDVVTINADLSGMVTGAINIGNGAEVFANEENQVLRFRRLDGENFITTRVDGDSVLIGVDVTNFPDDYVTEGRLDGTDLILTRRIGGDLDPISLTDLQDGVINGGDIINNTTLRLTTTNGDNIDINLGDNLQTFQIEEGSNIQIQVDGNDITGVTTVNPNSVVTINADLTNAVTDAVNIGTGAEVFSDKGGSTLRFRRINGIDLIKAEVNGDSVDVGLDTDGLGDNNYVINITGGVPTLTTQAANGSDADWYVAATANTIPDDITQRIYTRGRVGIGDHYTTNNPVHDLEIRSTGFTPFGIYTRNNVGTGSASMQLFRSRDNGGAEAALNDGDDILSLRAFGHNGDDFQYVGAIDVAAADNYSAGNFPSFMRFSTVTAGNTFLTEKIRIAENGFVGIIKQDPRYSLDVAGAVGAYYGGFLADHAYRIENGNIVYPPDPSNPPAGQYPFGGFMSLRNLSKRTTGYDWTMINMDTETNLNFAAGLHFWNYDYYNVPFGPADVSSPKVVFTDNGRVGINNSNPAHALTVVIPGTNITGSYQASGWQHSSDARLKDNVVTIESALTKVQGLRGVSFDWKDNTGEGKQLGFIAQEARQVVPEVVSGVEGDVAKGETLSMNYANVTPLLVEAIKEQQAIIADLQARLAKLESK